MRRQIVSFLTHWKGRPKTTGAYVPYEVAPQLHLAVAGDVGEFGARLHATAAAMARLGELQMYDALLLLGDNVYPAGNPARLPDTVFRPFAPVLAQGTELLAILGNHDVRKGRGDAHAHAIGMPARWWVRRFGDTLIVGLDSTRRHNTEQLEFLDSTLGESDARWKIVATHHPPYSAGYQGSDHRSRKMFVPLFERHGVDIVFSGHDHDYHRSIPINGVTYVVTGGASRARWTGEKPYTAVSFATLHFVDVAIFCDRLVIRAVDRHGRVADEAVLIS